MLTFEFKFSTFFWLPCHDCRPDGFDFSNIEETADKFNDYRKIESFLGESYELNVWSQHTRPAHKVSPGWRNEGHETQGEFLGGEKKMSNTAGVRRLER